MPGEWTPELIKEQFARRLGTLFNGHVGIELIEAGHGFARLRLPIRDEILQPTGVVHGGAVATLADVTAGVAAHVSYPPGTDIVTVELKVNFIAGLREGNLLSEAKPLHLGRRTSVWEVRINHDSGRHVAFASGTFMIVKQAPTE
ncbi:MAG: PaaI family thioesterase [Nitrospinaceae bacterium]|jgi:1,4-dihydroxy-2-naphthoyl-CoA hydrolase|nr:PaaI family thioesterase [Nitrospinaceae bacterium]MBT3435066.1 PaaI family thioesterase [Nitrospinaceae bacterium]MBT3821824.1 PaaI family thioesterase [Nitrospinaceae bacterium]MBT4094627.1 PaaI family thioesterase [Nitrospinaceae bacterium]MBT5368852.1 PaaI family thioesterase [Nitrospinaceae bacterium]